MRLLQYENDEEPMLVTPSGMVILVKLLQSENAPFSIFFKPFGRTIVSISERGDFNVI